MRTLESIFFGNSCLEEFLRMRTSYMIGLMGRLVDKTAAVLRKADDEPWVAALRNASQLGHKLLDPLAACDSDTKQSSTQHAAMWARFMAGATELAGKVHKPKSE
eukprot:4630416-Alexandrium_andersonii.AAC.1